MPASTAVSCTSCWIRRGAYRVWRVVSNREPVVRPCRYRLCWLNLLYAPLLTLVASHNSLLYQFAVHDAVSGECLQPGRIALAPASHHLLVKPDGSFALSDAARVQSLRPAADVLFASVAPICTTRVIAVVLTGWDSDGSNGIQMIKHWGGTVIAQDEASSEVFQMPRSAIATGDVDAVLSLDQIAPAWVAQVVTRLHV